MLKRPEESSSDDEESINASVQLSSGNEAPAAQWIDEDDLDGMSDSEEDEFAEDRANAFDEVRTVPKLPTY